MPTHPDEVQLNQAGIPERQLNLDALNINLARRVLRSFTDEALNGEFTRQGLQRMKYMQVGISAFFDVISSHISPKDWENIQKMSAPAKEQGRSAASNMLEVLDEDEWEDWNRRD